MRRKGGRGGGGGREGGVGKGQGGKGKGVEEGEMRNGEGDRNENWGLGDEGGQRVKDHRLNMEVDLQSIFGLHVT